MCSRQKSKLQIVILTFGIVFLVCGFISYFLWNSLIDYIISKEFYWSQKSKGYESWRNTTDSVFVKFYLFNWTNPNNLSAGSPKPEFEEVGPYVFREDIEKINITWNSNHTVSYHTKKTYFYEAELSNGSLSDLVTNINIAGVAAAYITRNWHYFSQKSVSFTLTITKASLVTTKTVRELLFDGYNDPLLSLKEAFAFIQKVSHTKVGWMVDQNGSFDITGYLNVATGEDDISKIGRVMGWNYKNTIDTYSGPCRNVKGNIEQWPPGQRKENITLFAPGLHRTLILSFDGEHVVEGLTGYRFVAGKENVDNGTLNEKNICYCGGDCLPSGVMNSSVSHEGGPVFMSYPHFYSADPFYRDQVIGMNPDEENHKFSITLEPRTGVPVHVSARMQINMMVDKSPYIELFKNVQRILMPVLWVEDFYSIKPDHAEGLRMLLSLPSFGVILSSIVAAIGIVLLLVVYAWSCFQKRRKQPSNNRVKEDNLTNNKDTARPLIHKR